MVKTKYKPEKETKRGFSKRVANKRINKIIKELELVKNFKSNNYNFTPQELQKIYDALNKELEEIKYLFFLKGNSTIKFTFDKDDN